MTLITSGELGGNYSLTMIEKFGNEKNSDTRSLENVELADKTSF